MYIFLVLAHSSIQPTGRKQQGFVYGKLDSQACFWNGMFRPSVLACDAVVRDLEHYSFKVQTVRVIYVSTECFAGDIMDEGRIQKVSLEACVIMAKHIHNIRMDLEKVLFLVRVWKNAT